MKTNDPTWKIVEVIEKHRAKFLEKLLKDFFIEMKIPLDPKAANINLKKRRIKFFEQPIDSASTVYWFQQRGKLIGKKIKFTVKLSTEEGISFFEEEFVEQEISNDAKTIN